MNATLNDFLNYLGCDANRYDEMKKRADPIVQAVQRRIGQDNYWQVSPEELRSIYASVGLFRGPMIAETGVGPGSTSYAILEASREFRGTLYSFDLGEPYGEKRDKPVGFLVPENLRDRWVFIRGDTKKTLAKNLSYFGPFDVFFHDSEHTYDHVNFELETALKNLRKRFLIMVDNYDWTEAPADFASSHHLKLLPLVDDLCFIFP
ncbi:MAG TPA: class I SAM-dependent methyltransferase [Thermoplasmataceae archaeon]|nr:class I SAM-dependent methyltransferase [Thermoplasmatales archaeon AK]HLH86802.1 class I SAM-dependent methyltransferase [Thermoplasmataceae archaeon]